MKRQSGFPGEAITEGLWLWLTLVTAIGMGTGATALSYSRVASESSALTIGFIVMVLLFVLSEAGYRVGWLPWNLMWRLNANAPWALERKRSHKDLAKLARELEATTISGSGGRPAESNQQSIARSDHSSIQDVLNRLRLGGQGSVVLEDYYRGVHEELNQLRKARELDLDRYNDLLSKSMVLAVESVREFTPLGSDILVAKHLELDRLLRSLLQSLEFEREVVELTRQHIEQQRELVGEILKRSEDSEPG